MSKDLLLDSFEHLRDVLAKCFPKANTFNEGASSQQIDAVEESTGWNIPSDLKRLLEIANGQPENAPGAFGGVSFLSTELMIHCHKRWCELADYRRRPPLEESVNANPHVGTEYSAYPHWVPFARHSEESYTMLYIDQEPQSATGITGQIFSQSDILITGPVIAIGLVDFLARLTDQFKNQGSLAYVLELPKIHQ